MSSSESLKDDALFTFLYQNSMYPLFPHSQKHFRQLVSGAKCHTVQWHLLYIVMLNLQSWERKAKTILTLLFALKQTVHITNTSFQALILFSICINVSAFSAIFE
ncbi:hypothetical protein XENTR_v10005473 [Xenopus tropicalis]|nr:hypothetical protein XENTR_v10005473 [Xenopus tropicalis]